jgi:DNA polymerase III subunit epsilon
MPSRLRPDPPSRHHRRRPWREAPYAALDFETTGLDYGHDTIVSFGVVPVTAGRVVVGEAVHQLVEPSVPPSPRSQRVHELRPADLAGSPRLDEVRAALAHAIAGRFLLVWFAEVELHFLAAIFGGRLGRWAARCLDVRNLAIEAEGAPSAVRRQAGFALSSTADRYGVPVAEPHQALDDAMVTAQLFLVLVGRLPGGPDPTAGRLLAVGRPGLRLEQRFRRAV